MVRCVNYPQRWARRGGRAGRGRALRTRSHAPGFTVTKDTRVTFDFSRAVKLHNIIELEQNPARYYHTMGQSVPSSPPGRRGQKNTTTCHPALTTTTQRHRGRDQIDTQLSLI